MPKKSWFYGVAVGHKTGVYTSWVECEKQVNGFPKAKYEKFRTPKEAEDYVRNCGVASDPMELDPLPKPSPRTSLRGNVAFAFVGGLYGFFAEESDFKDVGTAPSVQQAIERFVRRVEGNISIVTDQTQPQLHFWPNRWHWLSTTPDNWLLARALALCKPEHPAKLLGSWYEYSHAVVIGIDEYGPPSGLPQLRGCANDATAFAKRMQLRGFSVNLLVNAEATKEAIQKAILQQRPSENSRLVIYFAGHASQQFGLLPFDCVQEAAYSTVSLRDFGHSWFLENLPHHCLLILDCCSSGSLFNHARGPRDLQLQQYFGERSFEALCAGKASEASREGSEHGFFTKALLDGLDGAAFSPGSAWLSANHLRDFIQKNIPAEQPDPVHAPVMVNSVVLEGGLIFEHPNVNA